MYDNKNLHGELPVVCQSVISFSGLYRYIATVVISTTHVHFHLRPQIFVVCRFVTFTAPFCSWKARGDNPKHTVYI
jgi:hypothetical protein